MLLTYLSPLLMLSAYFLFQYNVIVEERERLRLTTIAENQANTLNLFLSERVINLSNLIDDPHLHIDPTSRELQPYLAKLAANSKTFVDIGYFGPGGIQTAYAGPYPSLEQKDYSHEPWYQTLRRDTNDFIITDIYLGFSPTTALYHRH